MELEVKGCTNCPMCIGYEQRDDDCFCSINGEDIQEYDKGPVTPSWCPLKIEPIIITLKEN